MKPRFFIVCVIVVLGVAAGTLRASDPMGVYALIETIKIHHAASAPDEERILIDGAFSLAVPRIRDGRMVSSGYKPSGGFGNETTGDVYGPVQVGYLYYACPPGQRARCSNEWNDLKAVAGTGKVVGFGGRHTNNGTVRVQTREVRKLTTPDVYPLNLGVAPIGVYPSVRGGMITNRTAYPDLIAALGKALAKP